MVWNNPTWWILAIAVLIFVIFTLVDITRSRLSRPLKPVWFFLAFSVIWSLIWWTYSRRGVRRISKKKARKRRRR